jgi:hypothetical protein
VADVAREGGVPSVSESYSFHEGELLFAFRRVTRPDGSVEETRSYFQGGDIYRSTRRTAGPGERNAAEDAREPAEGDALRVFAKVSRLALAADGAEAAAVFAEDPGLE